MTAGTLAGQWARWRTADRGGSDPRWDRGADFYPPLAPGEGCGSPRRSSCGTLPAFRKKTFFLRPNGAKAIDCAHQRMISQCPRHILIRHPANRQQDLAHEESFARVVYRCKASSIAFSNRTITTPRSRSGSATTSGLCGLALPRHLRLVIAFPVQFHNHPEYRMLRRIFWSTGEIALRELPQPVCDGIDEFGVHAPLMRGMGASGPVYPHGHG